VSRSAPEVILESWNRSSTIPVSRSVSPRIRFAYSVTSAGSATTPSYSASLIALMPASGVRRSWLIQATSCRRDASAARSASRASCSHMTSRPIPRPSSTADGTVTAATTAHTSAVTASCGVYMNPLVPITPASVATTGTSTRTVAAAVIERCRIRERRIAPSAATGTESNSATGITASSSAITS
jgi:hypothetical protein